MSTKATTKRGGAADASKPTPAPVPSALERAVANALGLRWAADLRMIAFEALYFGLVAYQWLAPAATLPGAVLLYAFTLHLAFSGACATHNCVHTPPFRSRALNSFWFVVLTLTIGHPVSTYIPGHNYSHHKYLATRKDIARTSQMTYGWNLLNLLLFVPNTAGVIHRNDWKYFSVQKGRPIWWQCMLELTALYGSYAVLVYTSPLRFVLYTYLPSLWAKYAIVTINLLQHDGCDPNSKHDFARNFVSDNLNYWTYNNGYHTIHHMYPGKHWSKLKYEHELRVKPYNHENLNQSSILWYIFTAYVFPGRREMYDGSPYVDPPDAKLGQLDWTYDVQATFDGDGAEADAAPAS